MKQNLLNNKKYFYLFSSLILLTIMFVITEVGLNLKLYSFLTPYKVTLLIAGVMFLVAFLKNPKNIFLYSVDSIKNQLKETKVLVIFIAIYIIFDLISMIHTNNRNLALVKYVTIISMLATIFLYIIYLNKNSNSDKVNILLVFLGTPSIVVSIYTWIYFFIHKYTYYARRLSLIQDYNKFSMLLFFSFIAVIYLIFRVVNNLNKRNLLLALTTVLCSSTIHLTASRRTSKMMNVILILFCLYGIYDTYIKLSKKNNSKPSKSILRKSLGKFFVAILVTFILSNFIIYTFNYVTTERVEKATQSDNGDSIPINRGVEDILEDSQALDKRSTIWKIAIKSYRDYPLVNKIIGKGGSAHLDVYNQPENQKILNERVYWKVLPDNTVDPHNFLLVDLLNGGIILVGVTLLCMLTILVLLFKVFKKSIVDAYFIFVFSISTLGDIFISSRNGMFDNKFIWIILILLITVFNSLRNENNPSKVIE